MDIISTQKYVRISPKKLRLVADVAKKMSPLETLEKLPFLRKRGSEDIIKVIKSAIASAKQKEISDNDLVFKEIQIGEGPRLKRGRAASRGRWHPYKKRMSHIRIVLTTRKSDLPAQAGIRNPKLETGDIKSTDIAKSTEKENNEKTVEKKEGISSVKKTTKNLKSRLQSVISKKGAKK